MSLFQPCARGYSRAKNYAVRTHPEATEIQQDIFRRMTTEERLRIALETSDSMRDVALAALRSRHPELDENGLRRELLRIMYGFAPQQ